MKEWTQHNSFKEWSNTQMVLGLYQVEEAFEFFVKRRIKELEDLKEKCETDCEKQANIRVIQELKRLLK